MPKYRGFMNENVSGLGRMTSFGTGRTYATAPAPAPVVTTAAPAPVPIPIDRRATIMPVYGVPGDIRPITARIIPGEAIETDPANMVDDMSAEIGVPGVDETGGFPYGDPKAPQKPGAKIAPGNQALVLAAIAAALLLGG